jgi:hypothetical protein
MGSGTINRRESKTSFASSTRERQRAKSNNNKVPHFEKIYYFYINSKLVEAVNAKR